MGGDLHIVELALETLEPCLVGAFCNCFSATPDTSANAPTLLPLQLPNERVHIKTAAAGSARAGGRRLRQLRLDERPFVEEGRAGSPQLCKFLRSAV